MDKTDAVITLLHISDEDLRRLNLSELKDLLGSLNCVTRQIGREIVKREIGYEAYNLMHSNGLSDKKEDNDGEYGLY